MFHAFSTRVARWASGIEWSPSFNVLCGQVCFREPSSFIYVKVPATNGELPRLGIVPFFASDCRWSNVTYTRLKKNCTNHELLKPDKNIWGTVFYNQISGCVRDGTLYKKVVVPICWVLFMIDVTWIYPFKKVCLAMVSRGNQLILLKTCTRFFL